jgi:hypothetical protein
MRLLTCITTRELLLVTILVARLVMGDSQIAMLGPGFLSDLNSSSPGWQLDIERTLDVSSCFEVCRTAVVKFVLTASLQRLLDRSPYMHESNIFSPRLSH